VIIGTATAAEPSGDDRAAVVSLVKEAVEAWSRDDIEVAKGHMSPSVVLVDDTAPYFVQGPTAVSDWLKAFAAESNANDITDPWQTLGKPTEVAVDGPHACIAIPAVYGFNQHGKPLRVDATVAVTLEKSGEDWSFVSWSSGNSVQSWRRGLRSISLVAARRQTVGELGVAAPGRRYSHVGIERGLQFTRSTWADVVCCGDPSSVAPRPAATRFEGCLEHRTGQDG
jgi:hypothetical protein